MEHERLVSFTETAALSGLTPSHLRLLARKGKLRAFKVGKAWVTTVEAVTEYLQNPELRSKDPYKYKRG